MSIFIVYEEQNTTNCYDIKSSDDTLLSIVGEIALNYIFNFGDNIINIDIPISEQGISSESQLRAVLLPVITCKYCREREKLVPHETCGECLISDTNADRSDIPIACCPHTEEGIISDILKVLKCPNCHKMITIWEEECMICKKIYRYERICPYCAKIFSI